MPQSPPSNEPVVEEAQGVHHAALAMETGHMARQYHVPLDMDSHINWVASLAERHPGHEPALKEFGDYIKSMAQGLYPTLAGQIGAGIPTESLLSPYKMVAKQVLGPEAEPNWQLPHWNKALTGNIDEKSGRVAPMGLEQWRQHLIKDPAFGYNETPHAQEQQRKVLDQLHSHFHGLASS